MILDLLASPEENKGADWFVLYLQYRSIDSLRYITNFSSELVSFPNLFNLVVSLSLTILFNEPSRNGQVVQ